jgi:hypothetical protein
VEMVRITVYISGVIWADWVRLTKTLIGLSCAKDKAQRLKSKKKNLIAKIIA